MPLNVAAIAEDSHIFDNTESVTLFRRLTTATFDAGTAVANCLRITTLKSDSITAGALLSGTEVVWHVWQANLGAGAGPKVSDVIQDGAGVRWSVQKEVGFEVLTGRYQLSTVKER